MAVMMVDYSVVQKVVQRVASLVEKKAVLLALLMVDRLVVL